MYKNIKGCVKLNEEHIIIYGGLRRPSDSALIDVLKRAFPRLVSPRGWISESRGPSGERPSKMPVPDVFSRAIEEEDSKNDWINFPYVAMTLQSGVIEITPLSRM